MVPASSLPAAAVARLPPARRPRSASATQRGVDIFARLICAISDSPKGIGLVKTSPDRLAASNSREAT